VANIVANNYYWRAVRRIAKRYGITIAKARRKDWETEANEERKRRTKGARKRRTKGAGILRPTTTRSGRTVSPSAPHKKVRTSVSGVHGTRGGTIPRRISTIRRGKTVPPYSPASELEDDDMDSGGGYSGGGGGGGYDDEDLEDEWESEWSEDYPELDYLDGLVDFMEDFEYADDDKYKEPS
jgi:hypothetical protein